MKNLVKYLLLVSVLFPQERVMIEGEAEYQYSDNETLIEAKSLCYNMALRNAVESYNIFVSSMTDVHNWQLRNDIIQTLASGYLEDLTVVTEEVDRIDNNIYYKLRAYIRPKPFRKALKQEVARKIQFAIPKAIKENGTLRILKIYEVNGWVNFIYQNKIAGSSMVFITYYNEEGLPFDGGKMATKSLAKNEVRQGALRIIEGVAYYDIWLWNE